MFLKCYHVTESEGRETLLINLQDIKAIQKRYVSYKEMFVITVCYDDSEKRDPSSRKGGYMNGCFNRYTDHDPLLRLRQRADHHGSVYAGLRCGRHRRSHP